LVFPYGQLEAHVASHPFDFDDDGDVDAQDIAAGTSGGTCWGDYDGAGGDCKRLDANGDRDIDVDDYTIVNGFLTARHSEAALQRIPAASHSRRGNLFARFAGGSPQQGVSRRAQYLFVREIVPGIASRSIWFVSIVWESQLPLHTIGYIPSNRSRRFGQSAEHPLLATSHRAKRWVRNSANTTWDILHRVMR
jgi:hypothetical protein